MRTNEQLEGGGRHADHGSQHLRRSLDEAAGYLEMGLLDEVEDCLRRTMESGGAQGNKAQSELAHLLLGQRRFEESASLGLELIHRGILNESVIITAMLALHFLGRFIEARETLGLLGKLGVPPERESYQQACFAARLREFPEALRWLLMEFRRSDEYFIHCSEDTDLVPLWAWLGNHTPALGVAHEIIEAPWDAVRRAGRAALEDVRYSAGDLDEFPEFAGRLMKYDYNEGCYQTWRLGAARNPAAMSQLLEIRRARLAGVEAAIAAVYERAMSVVLAAQPAYAAEHASWGNHHGARCHILWALPRKPELMADFLSMPGLEMMRPLLEEYASATARDPEFGNRMASVSSCLDTDSERAWALLERTPAAVRDTGIYQLRLAGVYDADNDYARSLPIWNALRKRWPADVVGYGNAVGALIKLGRAEEAKSILENSPLCFRRYRTYLRHRAIFYNTPAPITLRHRKFLGRLDLNGEILPASCPTGLACYPVKPEA